jgi:hypothetical protein
MAKKSHRLAARVTALEKAFVEMLSGRKAKAKRGKKTPIRKSTKATKKKTTKKVANPKATRKIKRKITKSRVAAPTTALSRKHPEHGVFPDSPPIFAVDEADAEAAIGFKHGRR